MTVPVVAVKSLTKTFPGQVAVDNVSFKIARGEIFGLVGQNGSGKSTIIKILSGFHRADPGSRVEFLGQELDLDDSGVRSRHRMHFIHQDLGLIPTLDTVDNFGLVRGFDTGAGRRIRWSSERKRVGSLLSGFGVDLDVTVPVGRLAPGDRTMIAIIRALDGWGAETGLLVLDEPTVALSDPEVERLFDAVRRVAKTGVAVLFVSHRLEEVLELTDRVGVMRDGRLVVERETRGLSHIELIELIAGRLLEDLYVERPFTHQVVLRASGLAGGRLKDLSFELHAGEILGITGLLGSGRENVADVLFGSRDFVEGDVLIGGRKVLPRTPLACIQAGMGMVPSDRVHRSVIPAASVRENMTLPSLRSFWRKLRLDRRLEQREVLDWMGRLDVTPQMVESPISQYSGGNQQKIVLAKWLRIGPRVLILDEPTQGVDVKTKAAILHLLAEAAVGGMAHIIVSVDVEDLARTCDRVIVLREGRAAVELGGAGLTEHALMIETMRVTAKENVP